MSAYTPTDETTRFNLAAVQEQAAAAMAPCIASKGQNLVMGNGLIVGDATAPTISNPIPAALSTVLAGATLQADVADTGAGLGFVWIYATLADGSTDLVWNGSSAASGYGVSPSVITSGYRYPITRTAGWLGDFYLTFVAIDLAGNSTAQTFGYHGPAADTTPPALSNQTAAGAIASGATLSFDLTDVSGLGNCIVVAIVEGGQELVYDGSALAGGYDAASVVTSITNGLRFALQRDVGWYGGVQFTVYARDALGNSATLTSNTWTAPARPPADAGPPAITGLTPAANTTLAPSDVISFDVADVGAGILRVMLTATFSFLDAPEVVHDGGAFSPPYQSHSTRSTISGGYHYTLLRKDGWPEPPALSVYAMDRAGNEV